jgi:RNA polymerase sigma factor for flagellar operon FliA
MLANYLHRSGTAPMHAHIPVLPFAEAIGRDLTDLLALHDNDRQLVIENQAVGPDLYIAIPDFHQCIPTALENSSVTTLAREYARSHNATTRNELVVAAQAQVNLLAQRLFHRIGGAVPLEDLISEGNVGLLHAIDNYDAATGLSFKTYAEHKIRGAILDSLRTGDPLTRQDQQQLKALQRFSKKHAATHGETPTEEAYQSFWERAGYPPEHYAWIRQLLDAPPTPLSIDHPTPDGRLWCKRLSNEGSWQDASVCFGRGLVQRTAFRQTDHHPLRQLVHKFQIELQRPGDHDGGSRHFARSHDYPALGPALPAGIREALEALRAPCRRILEDG